MKKLLLILILTPSMLIAQNACKECSEFSKSKEWSKFIECVTKKIDQDGNINDYMCRATSYGFIFANLDSIRSFYKEDEYIIKEEAVNLFEKGMPPYESNNINLAITYWKKSVEIDPDNYIIRKQIWAIENPEKFYSGKVDYNWQKKNIKQNK